MTRKDEVEEACRRAIHERGKLEDLRNKGQTRLLERFFLARLWRFAVDRVGERVAHLNPIEG